MEMSFEKFKEYCCMQTVLFLICSDDVKVCCEDGTDDVKCKKENCPVFKEVKNEHP